MLILLFGLLLAQATAAAPPLIDAQIDPSKSYWDDHVHYGFPHQFAQVTDLQGDTRSLAYLDLYQGKPAARDRAPVLILIHGRTMHSGYWGKLIDVPLAAGFRVISIDWTNTGKSLRPNLNKPLTRTLDDVRQMIFDLVTRHLKIAKASYLGHSLGGQIVAGYVLDHPQVVERAVLYDPGGLETFPGHTPKLIQRLAHHDTLFNLIWIGGALPDIGENEDAVRGKFYSTRRPDAVPYLKESDPLSQFIVDSHRLALRGNPVELERLRKTHAWDTLASLMENGRDNPRAVLNRFDQLKVPTLLAFGLKNPIIPIPGTGNTDLRTDILDPLARRAAGQHLPLQIKVYDSAGHFIHTDLPDIFSRDVLTFLRTSKAAEPSYQPPHR